MCPPFVNPAPSLASPSPIESASLSFPGVAPSSPQSPCATSLRNTPVPPLLVVPRGVLASLPAPFLAAGFAPSWIPSPRASLRRFPSALLFCPSFAGAAKSRGSVPPPAAIPPATLALRQTVPPFARSGKTNPARSLPPLPCLAKSASLPNTPIRCIGRRGQTAPLRPYGRPAPATTNHSPIRLCCLAASQHLSSVSRPSPARSFQCCYPCSRYSTPPALLSDSSR